MPRYILIDHESGYVFGDTADMEGARDETPAEACRRLDTSIGEPGRTYTEHGPRHQPSIGLGTVAYHVYEAPADEDEFPLVGDGQDQDIIAAVETWCSKVAVVTAARTEDPR